MKANALSASVEIKTQLLKIGAEVFPVYGDEVSGFSIDPADLCMHLSETFRYRSLDELYFALVNLNVADEGQA